MPEHTLHPTGQHDAAAPPRQPVPRTLHGWQECKAGAAGALISLAPALTMGLLAFAALGPRGAAHGIPAALLASVVGGAVLAALARGPMAAGGPGAATVLPLAALVAGVAADPQFTADDPRAMAQLLALFGGAVVAAGALQVLLALTGLVRCAKYVPRQVLAGFMNGVALLALLAQLPLLLGWARGDWQALGWQALWQIQPATLLVGLVTIAVILLLPRLSRRVPATLVGLLVGSGLYAAIALLLPQAALGPLTGALPPTWPQWQTLGPLLGLLGQADAPLLQRHLGAAAAAGAVVALLGTLDLVLNSLALDQACHTRTDAGRETLALGLANVASGLVGGLPLLLLRPRALLMWQTGGRSRAALWLCCALFAALGVLGAPLLALLPQVVLGGVMVTIALLMADRWSLQLLAMWWRGPRTADLQLGLLVVGVVGLATVVLGFPAAVAAGALLSVLLFIRSMNRSLVRGCHSAQALPSRRIYALANEARLQPLRARITVLELEGALFFGSADRVAHLADALAPDCHTLVVDFRRVSLIDASGAVVVQQIAQRLHDRGIALLLAGVDSGNRHGRSLAEFAGSHFAALHGQPDVDQAVEAAELALLAGIGATPLHAAVPLADASLMQGLDAAQRSRLAALLQPRHLVAGERLFCQGDAGDRLYVVGAGSVSVFSSAAQPGTLRQRFASFSPGMVLGETAMLDHGGRTGDAVADCNATVHSLDMAALQHLLADDPVLCALVYRNLALHLSQRLRAAAAAWRASTA